MRLPHSTQPPLPLRVGQGWRQQPALVLTEELRGHERTRGISGSADRRGSHPQVRVRRPVTLYGFEQVAPPTLYLAFS